MTVTSPLTSNNLWAHAGLLGTAPAAAELGSSMQHPASSRNTKQPAAAGRLEQHSPAGPGSLASAFRGMDAASSSSSRLGSVCSSAALNKYSTTVGSLRCGLGSGGNSPVSSTSSKPGLAQRPAQGAGAGAAVLDAIQAVRRSPTNKGPAPHHTTGAGRPLSSGSAAAVSPSSGRSSSTGRVRGWVPPFTAPAAHSTPGQAAQLTSTGIRRCASLTAGSGVVSSSGITSSPTAAVPGRARMVGSPADAPAARTVASSSFKVGLNSSSGGRVPKKAPPFDAATSVPSTGGPESSSHHRSSLTATAANRREQQQQQHQRVQPPGQFGSSNGHNVPAPAATWLACRSPPGRAADGSSSGSAGSLTASKGPQPPSAVNTSYLARLHRQRSATAESLKQGSMSGSAAVAAAGAADTTASSSSSRSSSASSTSRQDALRTLKLQRSGTTTTTSSRPSSSVAGPVAAGSSTVLGPSTTASFGSAGSTPLRPEAICAGHRGQPQPLEQQEQRLPAAAVGAEMLAQTQFMLRSIAGQLEALQLQDQRHHHLHQQQQQEQPIQQQQQQQGPCAARSLSREHSAHQQQTQQQTRQEQQQQQQPSVAAGFTPQQQQQQYSAGEPLHIPTAAGQPGPLLPAPPAQRQRSFNSYLDAMQQGRSHQQQQGPAHTQRQHQNQQQQQQQQQGGLPISSLHSSTTQRPRVSDVSDSSRRSSSSSSSNTTVGGAGSGGGTPLAVYVPPARPPLAGLGLYSSGSITSTSSFGSNGGAGMLCSGPTVGPLSRTATAAFSSSGGGNGGGGGSLGTLQSKSMESIAGAPTPPAVRPAGANCSSTPSSGSASGSQQQPPLCHQPQQQQPQAQQQSFLIPTMTAAEAAAAAAAAAATAAHVPTSTAGAGAAACSHQHLSAGDSLAGAAARAAFFNCSFASSASPASSRGGSDGGGAGQPPPAAAAAGAGAAGAGAAVTALLHAPVSHSARPQGHQQPRRQSVIAAAAAAALAGPHGGMKQAAWESDDDDDSVVVDVRARSDGGAIARPDQLSATAPCSSTGGAPAAAAVAAAADDDAVVVRPAAVRAAAPAAAVLQSRHQQPDSDMSDISEMSSSLAVSCGSSSSSSSTGDDDDCVHGVGYRDVSSAGESRLGASAAAIAARRRLLGPGGISHVVAGSVGSISTQLERSSSTCSTGSTAAGPPGSPIGHHQQDVSRCARISGNGSSSGSSSRLQQPLGCVGLLNLGNTCFMNSILQCLNCCPEFVAALAGPGVLASAAAAASGDGAADSTGVLSSSSRYAGTGMQWRPNATVGPALCALLRDMWGLPGSAQQQQQQQRIISPRRLLAALSRVDERWGEGCQQDCQEFIICLLQRLQEEGNRIIGKPQYRELSGKGDETQQAAEAAANAAAWNSSLVDDLFRAQLQSTIICGGCGQRSHSFNSFLGDMALPLPARPGGVTLQDCLSAFVEQEVLTGEDAFKCDKCHQTCNATKRLQLYAYPQLLVLCLKRFTKSSSSIRGGSCARGSRGSSSSLVWGGGCFAGLSKTSVPLHLDAGQLLDLSPYCNPQGLRAAAARGQPPPLYELVAVSDHSGCLIGGHYSARGRSMADGRWWDFNDGSVMPDEAPRGGSSTPYVLFFRLAGAAGATKGG